MLSVNDEWIRQAVAYKTQENNVILYVGNKYSKLLAIGPLVLSHLSEYTSCGKISFAQKDRLQHRPRI
jgi:hypothetical protein